MGGEYQTGQNQWASVGVVEPESRGLLFRRTRYVVFSGDVVVAIPPNVVSEEHRNSLQRIFFTCVGGPWHAGPSDNFGGLNIGIFPTSRCKDAAFLYRTRLKGFIV